MNFYKTWLCPKLDSYDNMLISGDFSAEKFEFMSIKILECGLKKGQILGEGEKPKDNCISRDRKD